MDGVHAQIHIKVPQDLRKKQHASFQIWVQRAFTQNLISYILPEESLFVYLHVSCYCVKKGQKHGFPPPLFTKLTGNSAKQPIIPFFGDNFQQKTALTSRGPSYAQGHVLQRSTKAPHL